MAAEKTEKATPKRRDDERKKGNIFVSKDITTLVLIIVSFSALQFFALRIVIATQMFYTRQVERASIWHNTDLNGDHIMLMMREGAWLIFTTVVPIMLIIALAVILITGIQTRWIFTTEQMKFKIERFNPIKGLKKIVSLRSLVEMLKSLIKIIIIVWVLFGRVVAAFGYLPLVMDWEIYQAAAFIGREIMWLVFAVAIAFGALAILDYMYQRYEYEKGIKMSKQEIKDEYKQMEGSPEIKSKRREKQREYAMGRMMDAVPDADVVVRNPTHFAVAIKYELNVDAAPLVIAKGKDNIALKIIEKAEEAGVSVIEDRPLARSLYELSDIDAVIPAELFQPVAELLAWLYASKEKLKGKPAN